MKFWDASAVVPLVAREPTTTAVFEIFRKDSGLLLWWGTRVELAAAIARAQREGRLTQDQANVAMQGVRDLCTSAAVVGPSNAVLGRAERLPFAHELRAADAMQLAAALIGTRERPAGVGFVSLDRRLRVAAAKEGFDVLPAVAGPP